MRRTFLVALEIDDTVDAQSIAAEIQEVLLDEGFSVESVNPWSSPSEATMNQFALGQPLSGPTNGI